jgi:hypothetical protein
VQFGIAVGVRQLVPLGWTDRDADPRADGERDPALREL